MGTLPVHADTIALICNLKTGYISPQYHVVFDNSFETVYADEDTTSEAWETYVFSTSFRLSLNKASHHPGYQMNGSRQKNSPRLSPDKGVRKYPAVDDYTKICTPKKRPKTSNTNLLSKHLSPPLLRSTFLKQGRHCWTHDKVNKEDRTLDTVTHHPTSFPGNQYSPTHESSQSATMQKSLTSCTSRAVEHLLGLRTIL
jgi:hypothetical protein